VLKKTFGDTMPEIDEHLKLQRITKLLEIGGTMLATSHECGAPMFRYQGKVMCPVCDVQEEKKALPESEIRKPSLIRKTIQKEQTSGKPHDDIVVMIKDKTEIIAASLENETDLQRIKDKLECIELGMRILKLME
jgi:UPF0148 protein